MRSGFFLTSDWKYCEFFSALHTLAAGNCIEQYD